MEGVFALFGYFAIMYLIIGIPIAKVLGRTGFNRWYSLICVIPVINIAALWLFAFGRWHSPPAEERERSRQADDWSEGDKAAFKKLMDN